MAETRAYALRESVEGFSGGSVALGPDGDSLNVGQALEEGGGTIVTHDPRVIRALDEYPALKRVAASEAEGEPVGEVPEESARLGAVNPAEHSKDDLVRMATEAGADFDEGQTKPEIAAAIDAVNAETTSGGDR